MVRKDAKQVHTLLNQYLSTTFEIYQELSYQEVVRCLVPKEGVLSSYVVENEEGVITDFISYYSLPSQLL